MVQHTTLLIFISKTISKHYFTTQTTLINALNNIMQTTNKPDRVVDCALHLNRSRTHTSHEQ